MLRAIEESDLEAMRGWRNSPGLRKYFRQYKDLTPYDQARWYEDLVTSQSKYFFAIWYDHNMVGCCGLDVNWHNRNGELSLFIGDPKIGGVPCYIDNTSAPAALKDLLVYAFDTLGLHRVWAELFDYDDKKSALLKDNKFKPEATHKETYFKLGEWVDSIYYSLLESEWRSA